MTNELPTPEQALRQFFRNPSHPGKDATPEQIAAYEARVAEIDARLATLRNPQAYQKTVKQIRSALSGGKIK